MATFSGRGGRIKIGAARIAEVGNWSSDGEVDLVEDTEQIDEWRTFKTGRKGMTGSIEAMFDNTDTLGQNVMTLGATVVLDLLPEGDASAAERTQVTAIITKVGLEVPDNSDIIMRKYDWTATGAPVEDTLP